MAIAAAASPATVYMLRLDDEIGSTTWRYTREALSEAREKGADLLVVHLNTYGGSVEHADSIRSALLRYPGPVVGFVDNNAASAGALIALACDSVYMHPGSSMGAATVVNGQDGQAMPDKYQSYMRGMMRSTAEHHGRVDGRWRRNPLIAEAMVDTRVVVPGLVDSTRVLTFTPDEAVRWGYADGKADDLNAVLSQLNIREYRLEEYHPTWLDNLIGFFTNPAVQAVLIMIIVGGIYMELHTPGLGFPAAASVIAAELYFLPMYLTGIASPWIVLLFLAGVVLLVLEVFVIPGFGVAGISGICCIAVSLVFAMLENFSFKLSDGGSMWDFSQLWRALGVFTLGLVMAIGPIAYLMSSRGPKWFKRRSMLEKSQLVEDGYIGVDMSVGSYIGRKAVTVTDMRPVGKIEIDGETFDAVSDSGFLPKGTEVEVTRYVNAQLYVKKTSNLI